MLRNKTIASRLHEVFLNGRWIANTNYADQLKELDWQIAIQKTGKLNTIAALTYHINYYLDGLLNAFDTGQLTISDKYSFDLPGIESAEDWQTLVTSLLNNAEKFATAVEQMDDSLFDQPFIDEKYGTYLRNIEGVLEHSYYHLGQIVLLKKMITEKN